MKKRATQLHVTLTFKGRGVWQQFVEDIQDLVGIQSTLDCQLSVRGRLFFFVWKFSKMFENSNRNKMKFKVDICDFRVVKS